MAAGHGVVRFLDVALSQLGPLSYHAETTWLIRDHILSLHRNYPKVFRFSVAPFAHEDGTTVTLLCAAGSLPVSSSAAGAAPVQYLTIWLPQSYPYARPLLYLSPPPTADTAADAAVTCSHPFVDPATGAILTPYLMNWQRYQEYSNLTDLTRNLIKIFKFWPPFLPAAAPEQMISPPSTSNSDLLLRPTTDPSMVSRREAVDRLAMRILHEAALFKSGIEEEIEHLTTIQAAMEERRLRASYGAHTLDCERTALRKRAKAVSERAAEVEAWLEANRVKGFPVEEEEEECSREAEEEPAFEPSDEVSRLLLEHQGEEDAIDDVLKSLDTAMAKGVVPLDTYLKQVRALSTEQFRHRYAQMRLRMRSADRMMSSFYRR